MIIVARLFPRADLFERSTCSSQIQELRTWSTLQPVPSAITPLFKTLHNVFPGTNENQLEFLNSHFLHLYVCLSDMLAHVCFSTT